MSETEKKTRRRELKSMSDFIINLDEQIAALETRWNELREISEDPPGKPPAKPCKT